MYNILYRKLRIFQEIDLGTVNLGVFMPRNYALTEKQKCTFTKRKTFYVIMQILPKMLLFLRMTPVTVPYSESCVIIAKGVICYRCAVKQYLHFLYTTEQAKKQNKTTTTTKQTEKPGLATWKQTQFKLGASQKLVVPDRLIASAL